MDVTTSAVTGTIRETRELTGDSQSPDRIYYDLSRDFSASSGFTKPEVTRNPLVNGFRSPSSYAPTYWVRGKDGSTHANHVFEWDFEAPPQVRPHSKYDPTRGIITAILSGSGGYAASVAFPSVNVNEVRMKILNNVKDEVFDAAMVLAEMQSTVATLSGNLNRVGRSMLALKKSNPRSFSYLLTGRTRDNRRPTQKFLKETAGLYLEWKYGITPTLLDIQGACRGLDMNADGSFWDTPPLLVARSNRTVVDKINQKIFMTSAGGHHTEVSVPCVVKTTHKARIDYRIKNEALRGLNRYGIGLGTVATVLWDRHPFTFVLDMVIPIADIVKAWSALSGTEVVGYCETLYRELTSVAISGSTTLEGYPGKYTVLPSKHTSFRRDAFQQPPMPVPYVRNPIKTGNLATVLALFTQLRKG